MHALEKDAEERAERRRKNKILADELKAKGNEAFHQQLYEQAIDYYTEVKSFFQEKKWILNILLLGFKNKKGLWYIIYKSCTSLCKTRSF